MRAKHARQIRSGLLGAKNVYEQMPEHSEPLDDPILESMKYWDYALIQDYTHFHSFSDLSRRAFDRTINKEKERYEPRNYPR